MSLSTADRAYTNLIKHLQRPGSSISLQTVVSAIPHYLSQLALPHPTQLTAFIISSPLWKPPSTYTIGSLVTTYRSAVRLKESHLRREARGWFARDPKALIAEWANAVMKGVSRGDAQLRISILGGLLLGFDDLGPNGIPVSVRDRLEGQIVIACAEMLETASETELVWRDEFGVQGNEERDSLFLYSAYNILPSVATEKLAALDLVVRMFSLTDPRYLTPRPQALIRLAGKGVESAFSSGEFLSQLSHSTMRKPDGQVFIPPESGLTSSLQAITSHILYKDVGLLAKLLSRCLCLLADQVPSVAWGTFQEVSESIESITFKVQNYWKQSLLAALTSEQDIEPTTRALSTEIWKVLKTLLFTHLVVSQSILSSTLYLRPPQAHDTRPSPSSIACIVLRSLYYLSFVISQFGGVTPSVGGFKELRQVFYMALDIVAADRDPLCSNTFIQELLSRVQESPMDSTHQFRQSQTAFVLAVGEQLMPTLNESMVENEMVPFCNLYLNNPEHRETYESAHSVMLSIFAAHSNRKEKLWAGNMNKVSLAERMAPFYLNSLLLNSMENRLNALQLKLAFSSLVRSSTSGGDDALGWLCVDALLAHLQAIASRSSSNTLMSLYLTLVSLISCVSLALLPRVLSEVQKVLDSLDSKGRVDLGRAILEEITTKVGEHEKGTVLSWWCEVAPKIKFLTEDHDLESI